MKRLIVCAGLGVCLGLFFIYYSTASITFESLESKTDEGGPVFNRIHFLPGWTKDVWLMQQTHQGFNESFSKWDRLAIVVDKSSRPYVASFYQLPPGELNFEARPIPYKARCFACHANGPRAVRYNGSGNTVAPSMWGVFQSALWNLRIKAYGHVESRPAAEFFSGVSFKSKHAILSRPLGLKTCERCHSAAGVRNELHLEHVGTAHFLVRGGMMPPFPFQATGEEKALLERYATSGGQR